MILCCGEALIDFLPVKSTAGTEAFQPFNGGSIYNVAVALSRLGRPTGFYGGLSRDFFGNQLEDGLRESGVDLGYLVRTDRTPTLAFVRFHDGEPNYVFLDEGSAGRMLTFDDLPSLSDDVTTLHFGSISLIHDPAGTTLERLAKRHSGKRVISFDPNIRPGQIKDRGDYLRRFNTMIGLADIVKLSDADLAWLAPNGDMTAIAEQWLKAGVKLVAVTRGGDGAIAFHGDRVIECDPVRVRVADTIGAGDTFMAGLLAALDRAAILAPGGVGRATDETLREALNYASLAASVTVSRSGANPPWEHEV